MRWFLSLLLAVMLPLQSAWALAVPACDHAHGTASHAMDMAHADGGHCDDMAAGDTASADRDCHSACHHFSAVLGHVPTLGRMSPAAPVTAPLPPASPWPLMPRPERPQWAPLA